jgi:hypothetical protein
MRTKRFKVRQLSCHGDGLQINPTERSDKKVAGVFSTVRRLTTVVSISAVSQVLAFHQRQPSVFENLSLSAFSNAALSRPEVARLQPRSCSTTHFHSSDLSPEVHD